MQEDLLDVYEINLNNYPNISFYDIGTFLDMLSEKIFLATGFFVTLCILAIGSYSMVVGVYRKQKVKKK